MGIGAVAVTGGNGQIGRATLARLGDDYRTVNLSRGKRDRSGVAGAYLRTDLLDAGEVYGSLARSGADAVVHLGMVPRPDRTPGHVTYRSNVMTSYHVLEAAGALGVETVVLASSLSALGAGFEPDPVRVEYLPVDEAHPLTPTTPYGLGKRAMEVTADGVARRADGPRTVSSLRFPWVTTDADLRETFVDADRSLDGLREAGVFLKARNTLFAYLHVDDAVDAVRAALEADFAGHERFWLAAPDTNVAVENEALAADAYPEAERREALSGHRSLIDVSKARDRLGWEPTRSWRSLDPGGQSSASESPTEGTQ